MSGPSTRLSYLFLDVFLGAFIIAVVLMVTLAKPPENSVKVGSGTPRFVRIEVSWLPSSMELVPLLTLESVKGGSPNTVRTGRSGISPAAPIEPEGSVYWPKFDRITGQISRGENVPHKSLFMSGFTLGRVPLHPLTDPGTRLSSEEAPEVGNVAYVAPDRRIATLWMIDPEPGRWRFYVAPKKSNLSGMSVNDKVDIHIRMDAQGYESADVLHNPDHKITSTWAEFVKAKHMEVKPKDSYIQVPDPDE